MIVRRQSLLRRTLILLTGVLMATAPAVAKDDAPFFQLPESPIEGGKLFMEKGCVNCHAIHGLGGVGGPDLGRVQAAWSFLDIAGVMWNHEPKMEAEFVKKQHAPMRACEIEQSLQPTTCFPQEAPDHRFVANDEKRHHELESYAFSKGGLAIAGRAGQKNSVARLDPIGAQ